MRAYLAIGLEGNPRDRPRACLRRIGQRLTGTPNHPDALVLSIRALREAGFSEAELDLMFRKNPARLIGLPY